MAKNSQLRSDRARAQAKKRRNQRLGLLGILVLIIALVLFALFGRGDDSGAGNSGTTPGAEVAEVADGTGSDGNSEESSGGSKVGIEVLQTGEGEEVNEDSTVSIHYTIWLEDGTKFDSSLERGHPFLFTLGRSQVIRGLEEGILGMQVGGKRRLTIPPALAHGGQGFGELIPPKTTLIYEVELLDVLDIKIEEIAVGEGPEVGSGSYVTVHYTGWVEGGGVFADTRNEDPFTFVVGTEQVLPGWDIGMIGMRVGGQRRLTIPPELAYGDEGLGDVVPPGATVFIEVKLLDIMQPR